jgi:hypothetical protein
MIPWTQPAGSQRRSAREEPQRKGGSPRAWAGGAHSWRTYVAEVVHRDAAHVHRDPVALLGARPKYLLGAGQSVVQGQRRGARRRRHVGGGGAQRLRCRRTGVCVQARSRWNEWLQHDAASGALSEPVAGRDGGVPAKCGGLSHLARDSPCSWVDAGPRYRTAHSEADGSPHAGSRLRAKATHVVLHLSEVRSCGSISNINKAMI